MCFIGGTAQVQMTINLFPGVGKYLWGDWRQTVDNSFSEVILESSFLKIIISLSQKKSKRVRSGQLCEPWGPVYHMIWVFHANRPTADTIVQRF